MKGVTVFAKFFMKTFCENFSRKPQSDEKWHKISVEKEYMEPDPCFFGLLDPDRDPYRYIICMDRDSDLVPDPGLI
jgi:hypothetical protein